MSLFFFLSFFSPLSLLSLSLSECVSVYVTSCVHAHTHTQRHTIATFPTDSLLFRALSFPFCSSPLSSASCGFQSDAKGEQLSLRFSTLKEERGERVRERGRERESEEEKGGEHHTCPFPSFFSLSLSLSLSVCVLSL